MSLTDARNSEKLLQISANLLKLCREKNLSDSTIRLIVSIKRGEGEIGYQQRYQAILKITDILKGVTSDTEARSELEKAFPQYS